MRARRQLELLTSRELALPPAAGAGSGGPPRPPLAALPRTPAVPSARREWWAALLFPADVDRAQLERQARRAQDFTPRVSLAPPDGLLLELHGCLRLFGGVEGLQRVLRGAFPAPCRLAFAPTPLAAQVFTRAGHELCLVDDTQLAGHLAPLPLGALRWPEDVVLRLAGVGVRTIGAALRLPRAGFARRFGPRTLTTLDRLLGRQGDPHEGYVAPERYRRRCDPDVELTDQAAVLAVLAPLFDELERFLLARQRGITSLVLQLVHRHHAPTRHVLRLAAPALQARQFLRLLELQLARTGLPAPVRRCELRSGPLIEAAFDTAALWRPGERGGDAAVAERPAFLEQLRARLGESAVTGIALAEGHRPESLSASSVPRLAAASSTPASPDPVPWPAGRRPLWLLGAPAPLEEEGGWPLRDGRRLDLLAGPERLETGWWDDEEIQRDYYQALDARGARVWIFRDRRVPHRWFLHGIFS